MPAVNVHPRVYSGLKDIVSDAFPVNLAIVWVAFPLIEITVWSSISNEASSKPVSTSGLPTNSRPNVAIWTASSCSVPYEKRNWAIGHILPDGLKRPKGRKD